MIGSRHLVDSLAAELSLTFTTYQLGKRPFLGHESSHQLAVFERWLERCMELVIHLKSGGIAHWVRIEIKVDELFLTGRGLPQSIGLRAGAGDS